MFDFLEEKKKRKPIGKTEWEVIKKSHNFKCVICGRTEKSVGGLEKAHIKPHSKGGSQVLPMCPTCHSKHDKGSLTATEWKKLYLTRKDYERSIPKREKKKDDGYFFPSIRI